MSRAQMHSLSNYLGHGFFALFYGLVKYLPFPLSNYLRFFVLRLTGCPIHTADLGEGLTLWFPWKILIGPRSSLNNGVMIDGTGGVFIGEGVRIASYTVISTADHEFSDRSKFIVEQGFVVAPVRIEDDVWIGAGAKILKGVTIGKGAVIGAGAVVTKDIPAYSIAAGVPCRVIGQR